MSCEESKVCRDEVEWIGRNGDWRTLSSAGGSKSHNSAMTTDDTKTNKMTEKARQDKTRQDKTRQKKKYVVIMYGN